MVVSRLLLAASLSLFAAQAFAAPPPAAPPAAVSTDPATDLPKQVIGVTGSGDKLSLQLTSPTGPRALKIGDIYADGWRLVALSDSQATLAKAGQHRTVGLNPDGSVVQAIGDPGPKSTVQVAGTTDAAIAAQLKSIGAWDGQAKPGLTLDETQSFVVMRYRGQQYIQDQRNAGNRVINMDQANIPGYDPAALAALQKRVLAAGGGPGQ